MSKDKLPQEIREQLEEWALSLPQNSEVSSYIKVSLIYEDDEGKILAVEALSTNP